MTDERATESWPNRGRALHAVGGGSGGELPLSGMTVLELGHIVAGPFCSLVLADLGAKVIKVENPASGGDAVRDSSAVGNSIFNTLNRNKLSVTLNLKTEGGKAVFGRMARTADVVVENYAFGVAEALGVDYESLKAINPSLVYCSIKGFDAGPYERRPALDPVAEALSGLMSLTGHSGAPPVRTGTSVSDMAAALFGAAGILAALFQRVLTGEGQKVTAPLFESTVALTAYWIVYAQAYDSVPEPLGAGHPNWSPYDVFRTADGQWVFVGPSSERQWQAMCAALELNLHEQEAFSCLEKRRRNNGELIAILRRALSQWPAAELVGRLDAAGVPAAEVRNARQAACDLHLEATGAFGEIRTAEGRSARVRVPRSPIRSSAFQRPEPTDPPRLGADTDAVLSSLGYSRDEIGDLRRLAAL